MDISPTQLHPPAKRAVFQSPLITTVPTSCTSPLLTSQVTNSSMDTGTSLVLKNGVELHSNEGAGQSVTCPAFDTSLYTNFTNHSEMSFDHTPLTSLNDSKYPNNSYCPQNHTHQCMDSAFLPFKTSSNGLTPPTSSNQQLCNNHHFDSGERPHPPPHDSGGASSINNCPVIVTTIS